MLVIKCIFCFMFTYGASGLIGVSPSSRLPLLLILVQLFDADG